MTDYGYWKISRKFTESDPFWKEPREFSRAEAWIDLIDSAAWDDHVALVRGTPVKLQRGQLVASVRHLCDRWRWTPKKVRVFLDLLATMDRVQSVRTEKVGTVYEIVNYSAYQDDQKRGTGRANSGATSGTNSGADTGAQENPHHDTINATEGANTGADSGAGVEAHPTPDLGHTGEVKEVFNSTEDKSSGAEPRDLSATPAIGSDAERPAAPLPPNSNDEEPDGAEELDLPAIRAQLAPAIRKHLWLGNEPPQLVALSKPGWNMGRELNIATGFIERGEATVEELIGAMEYARRVLHHTEVKPVSMLAFNGKGRRDRLNEAIALWRRDQMKKRFHEHTKKEALNTVMAGLGGGGRATA